MLLNRKSLLKKDVLEQKKVDLGDGEFVFIRQMSAREKDRFEQSLVKIIETRKGTDYKRSLEDFRAKLVVVTACDEKGNLLLHPEDVATLSTSMSADKIEKLVNVAQKLNNITDEDKEGLVKNSEATQSGNSISASVKH